jgi:hypothetical protein
MTTAQVAFLPSCVYGSFAIDVDDMPYGKPLTSDDDDNTSSHHLCSLSNVKKERNERRKERMKTLNSNFEA